MTNRLRFVCIVFICLFLLVVARLFYWQVVRAEELSYMGKLQYGAYIKYPAIRGEILTSDNFPLATNKLAYLVFANPKEIQEKEKTSRILSSILSIDIASVSAALNSNKLWVPVAKNIDISEKEALEKVKLGGIGFEDQSVRFYPEASMAAHLIGFVGKDENGDDKGYFGLEGFYHRQLAGKPGLAVQIRDAFGRPILARADEGEKEINGRTIVLSIERSIQFIAQRELEKGIERYQAAGGMVGIIEPKTGSVLAMASSPSFDQRSYQEYTSDLYKNPFVSNQYEPGSTFKPLIMAAGIDSGVVKPETKCTICDKPVRIADYEIKTWNNEYNKNSSMIEVIQHSDNTGMVFVGQKLGLDRMLSYLKKFGIGEMTNIDLQGEIAPPIKDRDSWYPIDAATITFGQGISVTPIELLSAFASIANGGKRMEPHVVSKIITPDGKTIPILPKVADTPISEKTAKIMTEILVNAVEKGEAKWTKLDGYRVAGKTGTAQIPIAGHYDPNKTIASFMGFAPADDPKFAMIVIFDRPTTKIYGSETAAPVFFAIARAILNHYNISPTQ